MEESAGGLEPRVARIEADVAHLKEAVIRLDKKIDRLDDKFDELRRSLDSKFIWIVTTMFAFGAALLATMAKGFHWLK